METAKKSFSEAHLRETKALFDQDGVPTIKISLYYKKELEGNREDRLSSLKAAFSSIPKMDGLIINEDKMSWAGQCIRATIPYSKLDDLETLLKDLDISVILRRQLKVVGPYEGR